jgi:dihydroxyacetone kinase
VLAFVNGMGGTPLLELYIVYAEVARIAAAAELRIEPDAELRRYWDAPVNTPGSALGGVVAIDRERVLAWIERFAAEIDAHRQELVQLDCAIDDGNHGTNMQRGMQRALPAGRLATIPLIARKGRASYLGERSEGHQDPGATSSYYLFESAAATLSD